MRKNIALLALLGSLPALVGAQSLGDAARKERERREKNKEEGVVAREFSEKEIFGDDEEPVDGEDPVDDGEPQRSPSTPDLGASPLSSQPSESPAGGRDRARDEAMWRTRSQRAVQRVADARAHVQALTGLNLSPGERYIDAHGNTVITSLAQLRRIVTAADEELLHSERALAELREEARRAGVPPGWLR